ncbi:MAG: hypothetical protein PHU85_16750 [Phycisphaerae bacterium]|nr:hypothetical protein [Phycisphaerae bacterium]
MEFAAFLPDFSDQPLRTRLWGLFGQAEVEAQRFESGGWITITSVLAGPCNSWSDGRITLTPRADDLGALFGEVFRSAFERCRFHNCGSDDRWCGAFCDAFRYFMERQLGLSAESPWFARNDSFCGQTLDAVLARPDCRDPMHDRRYGYPASLLIARAGRDYDMFRAIWFDLQEQRMQANQPLLDWKFGYSVPPDAGQ